MGLRNYYRLLKMQAPVLLQFDHLYSEYQIIKAEIQIKDQSAVNYIDQDLLAKREDKTLTWNNLYYFELILASYQPVEKLRSKIMRLRYDYRSVAGAKVFDDYLASKPPDLQSPPDPSAPPPTQTQYEKLLREDLKDLVGRLYMRYAILPVRETRLNILTWIAAGLCFVSLITLLIFVVGLFKTSGPERNTEISSLTILVVVITGAMGGFVSALQRIQSPPTEGDSLYNLSLIFYGSYTVFVAPITGAIFAILLYLMFTSQVLAGTFFPIIYTPPPLTETNSVSNAQNPSLVLISGSTSAASPQQTSATAGIEPAKPTELNTTPISTPAPVAKKGVSKKFV